MKKLEKSQRFKGFFLKKLKKKREDWIKCSKFLTIKIRN
jgi:hypothetical protein